MVLFSALTTLTLALMNLVINKFNHGQISALIEHRCFGNFCILVMALPVSN